MRKEYERYKPTGIEWISHIPAHWNVSPIKRIFDVFTGATPDSSNLEYWNGKIAWVTPADFNSKQKYIKTGDRFITKEGYLSCATRLVPSESIIFSKRAPVGKVVIAKKEMCTSQGCLSCVKKQGANANELFFYYSFLTIEKWFNAIAAGTTFNEIGTAIFSNTKIPVPPRKEQDQIVRFLDWKVSSINKLINIKQKEIEVLEEQRAALISQATHCGILKPSKLKESGFAWMGDIPVNWHIRRFSKVAVVRAKIVSPQEHLEDMQISPASIEKGSGRILYTQTVKEAGVVGNNHRFYRGQIIYSKIRPLLNKVAIAPFDGLCSTDMYPIETSLETRYLKYFMLSQNFLCQLSMTGDRVKMPRLNQIELASVFIAFPEDKKEQKEIADYLDKVCERIQASIECIKLYIAMLRELSARLIADAVTGKIDVRNITVPEYEYVEDTADDDSERESEVNEGLNEEEE
ncbi:MAG: restriction endonuclease subunit S [Clostridia bacterium]|nr:restriction endonuclease subunit S [Peptococcus niger]MDU7244451.1 restriction endonuclease subunit S [Clostridiales bacterium]MDU7505687.1 restriction endonuclease subunit S [Clostridia bacterium]